MPMIAKRNIPITTRYIQSSIVCFPFHDVRVVRSFFVPNWDAKSLGDVQGVVPVPIVPILGRYCNRTFLTTATGLSRVSQAYVSTKISLILLNIGLYGD